MAAPEQEKRKPSEPGHHSWARRATAPVVRLLVSGVPPTANAFKAIGYREVLAALRAGENPAATRGAIRRSTRRYAKRQRSWLRAEPGLVWLDAAQDGDLLADRVIAAWSSAVPDTP